MFYIYNYLRRVKFCFYRVHSIKFTKIWKEKYSFWDRFLTQMVQSSLATVCVLRCSNQRKPTNSIIVKDIWKYHQNLKIHHEKFGCPAHWFHETSLISHKNMNNNNISVKKNSKEFYTNHGTSILLYCWRIMQWNQKFSNKFLKI